jgi:rhodanese-related sulfurtransferase
MKRMEILNLCADFVKKIPDNLNYITPVDLKKILDESPQSIFVLDVRNMESYNESHIVGAVNICIDDIFHENNISKIPIDKQVVVCCGIGHVASQILTLLQIIGYDAIGLKYGMGVSTVDGEVQKGWEELGFPVISNNQK